MNQRPRLGMNRGSVLLIALLFSFTATAQTPEATPSVLFQQGREAFNRGDFRGAAEKFEAAYRVSPHEATLYNAGVAWSSAGESARAADDFELALDSNRDEQATYLQDARERLAGLKRMLGYLDVAAPIGWTVTVAHRTRAAIPARIHVLPGKLTVTFTPGHGAAVRREISIHAGEVLTLGFPAPPELDDRAAEDAAKKKEHAREVRRGRNTLAFAFLGGATLFAAGGLVAGLEAFNRRDHFYASGFTDGVSHDQAATLRTLSNVAWGVGGAAAIVSITFFAAAGAVKSPPEALSSLSLRLGAGNAAVSGQF